METTIFHQGYSIEIMYDDSPSNPFEEHDGVMPLMVERTHMKDYSKGDIDEYLSNFLTYNQVKRHLSKILDLMEYSVDGFQCDYPSEEYDRPELIRSDILPEWLEESIENKEKFCKAFKIKHYKVTSKGYSQGDWADCFLCWTPEFEKVTGRDYKSIEESDFVAAANLYGYWAWGDVYGYSIKDTQGNEIDSCWGYYGDDHKENGILDAAIPLIEQNIFFRRIERFKRLKALIGNRVPLYLRTKLLTQ